MGRHTVCHCCRCCQIHVFLTQFTVSKQPTSNYVPFGGRPRPGSHHQTFDDHLATRWLHPMGTGRRLTTKRLRQKRPQKNTDERCALGAIIFDGSRGGRARAVSALMLCFFGNVFQVIIIQGNTRIVSNRTRTLPAGCRIWRM